MSFAVFHRDDAIPALAPLPNLIVSEETSAEHMAALQGRSANEIERRFVAGHRAYVARLNGDAAAWGWVATRTAEIGELQTTFTLPDGERYLWNFVTLPAFRGRGISPRLLQAILRAEATSAERFWIAYAPENHASQAGIAKAGFVAAAALSFDASGRPALRAATKDVGIAASRVLGIRETSEPLAPCWRCTRAGRVGMSCGEQCECDYQRKDSGCAA